MTDLFPQPDPPVERGGLYEYVHAHRWYEAGATRNPNGTWSSIWMCTECPDVARGGYVGTVPPGFCHKCHWVQVRWPRKRCEECKTPFQSPQEDHA